MEVVDVCEPTHFRKMSPFCTLCSIFVLRDMTAGDLDKIVFRTCNIVFVVRCLSFGDPSYSDPLTSSFGDPLTSMPSVANTATSNRSALLPI